MNLDASPYLLAAVVLAPNILHFILTLVVILAVCGLIAFLVSKSPIQDPWRGWIIWCLYALPVVYVVLFLLSLVNL